MFHRIMGNGVRGNVSRLLPVTLSTSKTFYDSYAVFSRDHLTFRPTGYSLKRERNSRSVWISGNGIENRAIGANGFFVSLVQCRF